jgi:Putative peptidoglycan binding domain
MICRVLAMMVLAPLAIVHICEAADVCRQLESEGRLVAHQLRASKICTESQLRSGWTDCRFSADATTILLGGAIGTDYASRLQGVFGSGFHIESLDHGHIVRSFLHPKVGFLLQIAATDRLSASGCGYNEAYITLNAQVLGAGDLNRITYGLDRPVSEQDRIRLMQQALVQLGYVRVHPDGVMGQRTRQALQQYRERNKLPSSASDDDVIGLVLLDGMRRSIDRLEEGFKRVEP